MSAWDGSRRAYRRFCLGASAAFLLVAIYTVGSKWPSGELQGDWVHSALHLASGVLALAASAAGSRTWWPRAFTVGILAVYGSLGVVGWFVDGLAMHTALRIPLQPADNVFHLLLALAALGTAAVARRRGRRAEPSVAA